MAIEIIQPEPGEFMQMINLNNRAGRDRTSNADLGIGEALQSALESAAAARSLIPAGVEQLTVLLDAARDPVERAAREYQIDLLQWQLNRAADLAEKRLDYIPRIRTREQADAENARCALDAEHWFEYYAWSIDPRPDAPLSLMPFGLFDFQKRFIRWLDDITFKFRKSGVVEKARDMGATETFLRWVWRHWRYTPGFIALLLSANEDLVDSTKDPATLFEKVRLQTRLVPPWMLPEGFNVDKDMPYMRVQNPENESIILGDAPTPNVGRQRRATVVGGDEYAAWNQGGYPQYTALSRTTNTFVPISSVQGKFNKFYDLANDGVTLKFEMDWREHPWRDERWYNALPFGYIGAAMTAEEIAQEVDRNYDASQPGRVLKHVSEAHCFITWEEMVAGFAAFGTDVSHFYGNNMQPKLPDSWNWGRVSDYGESARDENDTHIWAYSLFARPQKSFPFSDSLFFFHSRPIEPIGASESEAFAFYSGLEEALGVRQGKVWIKAPSVNDMSHEATDPKEVLQTQFGDTWRIPDLDFDKGRRKLVFHFELTDKHLPNPFRPFFTGRTRIYFVALPAPDGSAEYALARNDNTGAYFVTPSQTQGGFKRLRKEISSWHYPPEERGKPVQKMRPKSVFDDIITTVRYAVARWGVDAANLTKEQQREASLPPAVQLQAIATVDNMAQQEKLINARRVELDRLQQQEQERRRQAAKYRPMVPRRVAPSKFRR